MGDVDNYRGKHVQNSARQKVVAGTIGLVAISAAIAGGVILFGRPPHPTVPTPVTVDVATSTVPSPEKTTVEPIPGWNPFTIAKCGIDLQLPPGWIADSELGATIIRSPEDILKNKKITASRTEFGEGGADLIYRSLYVDCFPDFQSYVTGYLGSWRVTDENSLSDLFDSARFQTEGGYSWLVKKISLGGQIAYEIAEKGSDPDGKITMRYHLISGTSRIYDFELDDKEYDALSPTVKQIFGTIVFTK